MGKFIMWNQLCENLSADTQKDVELSVNSDGSYTANGTASASYNFLKYVNIISEHYYLLHASVVSGSTTAGLVSTFQIYGADIINGVIYANNVESKIIQATGSGRAQIRFHIQNTYSYSNYKFYLWLVDLTQMFGAGNEPTTVEEFEAMFPLDYYPYNPGTQIFLSPDGKVKPVQLVPIPASSKSKTENGVTITDNRDGSYTFFTDSEGATANTYTLLLDQLSPNKFAGHKIYVTGISGGSSSTYQVLDYWSVAFGYVANPVVVDVSATGRVQFGFRVLKNAIITTPVTVKPQLIDLTAMFGAGYEPSLEQCQAMFPDDYYEYFDFRDHIGGVDFKMLLNRIRVMMSKSNVVITPVFHNYLVFDGTAYINTGIALPENGSIKTYVRCSEARAQGFFSCKCSS